MKTKLCRPLLIKSDVTVSTRPFSVGITLCNDARLIIGNPVGKTESRMELILISLDLDEKIEDGTVFYTDALKDGKIWTAWRGGSTVEININTAIKASACKKVIATQSQLSPEYIDQFIEDYNKGEVKDVEIEMEMESKYELIHKGLEGFPEDDNYWWNTKPKLTNGFVTIVGNKETTIGKIVKSYSTESNKWFWMMDYCQKNKLPPAQKWAWDLAESEYVNRANI